jgi:hypothetical protein
MGGAGSGAARLTTPAAILLSRYRFLLSGTHANAGSMPMGNMQTFNFR